MAARKKKADTPEVEASAPMDPSIREDRRPTVAQNHPRECYAIRTLVAELTELFPETLVLAYTERDGRNTALAVSFDVLALSEDVREPFRLLTQLVENDHRVETVVEEDDVVMVVMRSSLLTQDLRDRFGLREAYSVLSGTDGPGTDEDEDSEPEVLSL